MKHEIYVIGKSGVSSGAAAQHDIQYVQCYQWYSLYVYIYIYIYAGWTISIVDFLKICKDGFTCKHQVVGAAINQLGDTGSGVKYNFFDGFQNIVCSSSDWFLLINLTIYVQPI